MAIRLSCKKKAAKVKPKPDGRNPVIVALELFILEMEQRIMAQIDDLNAAVVKLQTDVTTLIAAQTPQDLSPAIKAIQNVDAQVLAAIPPAVPPKP